MELKDIKTMTFAERGREITRLRRAVTRWAKLHNNQKCHEEDDRLANAIGLESVNRITISAKEFKGNCDRYIARECRAGRLTDDRDQGKPPKFSEVKKLPLKVKNELKNQLVHIAETEDQSARGGVKLLPRRRTQNGTLFRKRIK